MNKKKMTRKKKSGMNWGLWLLLVVFMVVASFSGYAVFNEVRGAVTSLVVTPQSPEIIYPTPKPVPVEEPTFFDVTAPLQKDNGPRPQFWDGQSRINILLLGIDERFWEPWGRTADADTIILVSVDPRSLSAGILSIPTDLWVTVPAYGNHPIKQVYQLGETNQVPGGGAGLTVAAVETLLDITIPHYALVKFSAFGNIVDEIGGIEIDIPESIEVTPFQNPSQFLEPGVQTLDGNLTLAYARTRTTTENDFGRAARQQEILLGIRQQLIDIEFIPTLIANAPELYRAVAAGIKTNLNLQQVVQLAWLSTQIPVENIHRETIGPEQVTSSTSHQNEVILQPIPEEVIVLREKVFSAEPAPIPELIAEMSEEEKVAEENALISLRNGTYTVGLAAYTIELLEDNGIFVNDVANADQTYANTTLIIYAGKPYTVSYLTKLLNVPQNKIFYRADPSSDVDILVILGEDWAASNELQ